MYKPAFGVKEVANDSSIDQAALERKTSEVHAGIQESSSLPELIQSYTSTQIEIAQERSGSGDDVRYCISGDGLSESCNVKLAPQLTVIAHSMPIS